MAASRLVPSSMRLATKVAAGALLGFGLMVSMGTIVEIFDPHIATTDKENARAALLVFGIPCTAWGSLLFWGGYRKDQRQKRDRLRSVFFQLIQQDSGHVTPIRFAMETGLDGTAAKAYLDSRAKEFNAAYHVNEEGTISYYFDLGKQSDAGSA